MILITTLIIGIYAYNRILRLAKTSLEKLRITHFILLFNHQRHNYLYNSFIYAIVYIIDFRFIRCHDYTNHVLLKLVQYRSTVSFLCFKDNSSYSSSLEIM